jgi:mRNA degradation ribonuclease J1/J2
MKKKIKTKEQEESVVRKNTISIIANKKNRAYILIFIDNEGRISFNLSTKTETDFYAISMASEILFNVFKKRNIKRWNNNVDNLYINNDIVSMEEENYIG